jgi:hypothetical protein
MTTTTQNVITYLSLFEKYGDIKKASPLEMQAAAKNLNGKNALTALFEAGREYEQKLKEKHQETGVHPAVCFNRDGHCEDDHCRCWK